MSKKLPTIVECPVCSDEIKFRRPPYQGQKKDCPSCFAELEVTSVNPVYLEEADFIDSYSYSGNDDWENNDWE